MEVTRIYFENLRVILEADKDFCDVGVGNRKKSKAAQPIMGEDWLDATEAATLSRTILNILGPVHLRIPEIKDDPTAQGMSRFVQVEFFLRRKTNIESAAGGICNLKGRGDKSPTYLPTYLPTTRPGDFRFEEMHQIRLSLTNVSKSEQMSPASKSGHRRRVERAGPASAPGSSGTGNAIRSWCCRYGLA